MPKSPGVAVMVGGFSWAIWKISQDCIQDSSFCMMKDLGKKSREAFIRFIRRFRGCECARPDLPGGLVHLTLQGKQVGGEGAVERRQREVLKEKTWAQVRWHTGTSALRAHVGWGPRVAYLQEVLHLCLHTHHGLLHRLSEENNHKTSPCFRLHPGKRSIFSPQEAERLTALGMMGVSVSGSNALIIGRLLIGTCILTGATGEKTNKKPQKSDKSGLTLWGSEQADRQTTPGSPWSA